MSLSNVYSVGLNNVGSYQVSGIPFALEPSSTAVTFPSCTRWVNIINNSGGDITVGFSANGLAGSSKFAVKAGTQTGPLELKLTELHLSATSSIFIVAGLTNIPTTRINNLSGSGDIVGNNWSGSVGVG